MDIQLWLHQCPAKPLKRMVLQIQIKQKKRQTVNFHIIYLIMAFMLIKNEFCLKKNKGRNATTPNSTAKTPSGGDRFIPNRSSSNFDIGHYKVY